MGYVKREVTEILAPAIDWTMNYPPTSDILWVATKYVRIAHAPPLNSSALAQKAKGRDMLLLWIVSQCGGPRAELFQNLSKFLPAHRVTLLGKCGKALPCPGRYVANDPCYRRLFRRYKFYFGAENMRCSGYITEKATNPLILGTVPIVYGGKGRQDYESLPFPPHSFIHVDDFPSVEALAKFMLYLDADSA